MNLRSAIELTDRCILLCRNGRWAATAKEGETFDSMVWCDRPGDALLGLIVAPYEIDDDEGRLLDRIAHYSVLHWPPPAYWACEWIGKELPALRVGDQEFPNLSLGWIAPMSDHEGLGWRFVAGLSE